MAGLTCVALWVGGQLASVALGSPLLMFRSPTLSAVDIAPSARLVDCSVHTVGGGVVTLLLTGRDFGSGANTTVRIGAGVCTVDVPQSSHDRIVCATAQCFGNVVVTVSGKSSVALPYDYNALVQAPRIGSVFPVSGPTVGGTELRIVGSFFRQSGNVSFVEVDAANARTNVTAPCVVTSYGATEIRCVSPPGDGARFELVVFAGGFSSSPYRPLWRYFSPVVLSTDTAELPTHPIGMLLTVFGRNFGWRGLRQGSVTVGSRPCIVIAWDDTQIECSPPVGTSASAAVEVVASGIPSTDATSPPSVFVRYRAPAVLRAWPSTFSTTGGDVLTILGRDFGVPLPVTVWLHPNVLPNDAAALAGVRPVLTCPVLTSNSSATVIQCTTPVGYGTDWVVTVINHADAAGVLPRSQIAANTSVRVGYKPPTVVSVAVVQSDRGELVDVDVERRDAAPAVGGFLFRVRGANLSPQPTVLVSGDECSAVGDVSASHDSVVCRAPPRRVNADPVLVVQSGGLVSNGVWVLYDGPRVTSLEPAVVSAMAHLQVATLRVNGVNFGVVVPVTAPVHRVAIGGRRCLTVSWLSDAALACLFGEELVVGSHSVTVWVGDVESRPTNVSVRAECPPPYYGADGERCVACPEGGRCDGGASDPIAVEGFYRVSRAVFVQCQPREACLGGVNSTCHPHYGGIRCADCAVGTYRCVLLFCRTALCCSVMCISTQLMLRCVVLCCAVLCCVVLCCVVLCCAVLCCAVLCCAEM
jgi:hypothetical protein